jgi:hypothetical protein
LRVAFLAILAALILVPTALSATTGSASFVSPSDRAHVVAAVHFLNAPELAYLPTKGPAHYKLLTQDESPSSIILTFADIRYAIDGHEAELAHRLVYTVARYGGKLSKCGYGGFTVAGKTVYWNGHIRTASTCVKAKNGAHLKITANGPFLTKAQLGSVIASSQPVG